MAGSRDDHALQCQVRAEDVRGGGGQLDRGAALSFDAALHESSLPVHPDHRTEVVEHNLNSRYWLSLDFTLLCFTTQIHDVSPISFPLHGSLFFLRHPSLYLFLPLFLPVPPPSTPPPSPPPTFDLISFSLLKPCREAMHVFLSGLSAEFS